MRPCAQAGAATGTIDHMAELTLPLTGAQYDIAAGDYQASITELGAGLRGLSFRGQPVTTGYNADELPPAGAGQLLLPWPNRIDHGRYSFGGSNFQLGLTEPALGNAIHGLTRWASWQLSAQAADQVELSLQLLGRPGYPFRLDLRARYQLTARQGLEVTVTAANTGSRPAPYGTGSHPYLRAGTGSVDDWHLQLPATLWQPADDRGIPVGPPQHVDGSEYDFRERRPIGSTSLDHAFTGLGTDAAGWAWASLTGRAIEISLWAGPGYRWLQVFTGDPLGPDARRRALAIEPMTCPPNAFVTGTNLLTIAPGSSVTHSWGIRATAFM
jgi:aldose 1-epimerase